MELSHVCVCMCAFRLMTSDPSVLEVLQRSGDLAHWLEQTEASVLTLPATAPDQNLRELKVRHRKASWHCCRSCITTDIELKLMKGPLRNSLTSLTP